jgi:hypothetical protein
MNVLKHISESMTLPEGKVDIDTSVWLNVDGENIYTSLKIRTSCTRGSIWVDMTENSTLNLIAMLHRHIANIKTIEALKS